MTLKAKLTNRSGPLLLLPKMGMAPMLFLEFVSGEQIWPSKKLSFRLHLRPSDQLEAEDYFAIRFDHEIPEVYAHCCAYINANL